MDTKENGGLNSGEELHAVVAGMHTYPGTKHIEAHEPHALPTNYSLN
jgi:hypothetical protein